MNKRELLKKLEKYDDYAEIVIPGRVSDELWEVESVRKNPDGQIVLRPD